MIKPLVSIVMVTFDSALHLAACLAALSAQTYRNMELIVVDNASRDGSLDIIEELTPGARMIRHHYNRGFCAAFNRGVEESSGKYVLSLNPDVVAEPEFVEALVEAIDADARTGICCGKLLRPAEEWPDPMLDSAGLELRSDLRVRDRGSGEVDCGQYDDPAPVFGACGAAALYRRAMLDDVAVQGEYLSESLFAYWDDVDLSWRARRRGWECFYTPSAVAYHARGGADRLSTRSRDARSATAQLLSIRNRYLVLARNEEFAALMKVLPRLALSDAPRWAYVLLRRPSLLRAALMLKEALPDALNQRRIILNSGRVRPEHLRRWIGGRDE